MKRKLPAQIRWGEASAFLTILVVGIVIFIIQLWTWAIPQLTLYQEFVPGRGIIFDKRVAEKNAGAEILFRPEILLEHSLDGKTYRVWTFDYQTLKSQKGFIGSRQAVETALESFTVGQRTNCWYRVHHPKEAIVVWDISIWGWFLLFLSFSLIILGVVGFSQAFRLAAVSKERRAAFLRVPKSLPQGNTDWNTIPDIQGINESPGTHLSYRLPLGHRPIFPLLGQTAFATAWTIIATAILMLSFLDLSDSWADQFVSILFRIIFCTIGIVLYWIVARQLWITFRVAPTLLELSNHPISPRRKYRVLLHQNGALQFEHLSVDLVCEEVARFHQGTDTVTNRQDVFRQTIFERADFKTTADEPLSEEFFIQLPEGVMHSFRGKNNEVVWKLEFIASLAGWPELRRDCPIVVRPGLFSGLTDESGL